MAKPLNNLPLRRSARLQQWQGSCLGGLQSTLVEESRILIGGDPMLILIYGARVRDMMMARL